MTWILDNLQLVLSIIIVFGALIFFHELGHFLLAKRAGILAREFAIGFGPKIFSFKKGETRYTLRIFPLGGFVRMAGEDPELVEIKTGQTLRVLINPNGEITHFLLDDRSQPNRGEEVVVQSIDLVQKLRMGVRLGDEEREYRVHPQAVMVQNGIESQIAPWDRQFGSKTISQRFWTLFAGPLFNFLLAMILFIIIAVVNGVEIKIPTVGTVLAGTPAEEAGLQPNDRIININGKTITSWDIFQQELHQNVGQPVQIIIERNQEQFQTTVVPKGRIRIAQLTGTNQMDLVPGDEVVGINETRVNSKAEADKLIADNQNQTVNITVTRIKDDKETEVTYPVDLRLQSIQFVQEGIIGFQPARDRSLGTALLYGPKETATWIGRLVGALGQMFTSKEALNQVGGPVAIFKMTGDMADRGIAMLMFWAAFLSINLGIFNLLPIPALDGGRLVFLAIEAIRGKPIDPNKESLVHFIGFAFLMLLIVLVTWNDIQRLFM